MTGNFNSLNAELRAEIPFCIRIGINRRRGLGGRSLDDPLFSQRIGLNTVLGFPAVADIRAAGHSCKVGSKSDIGKSCLVLRFQVNIVQLIHMASNFGRRHIDLFAERPFLAVRKCL